MRYKVTFAAGFAAGFLAGARAGRGAYDKIVAYGQQVARHPKVQEATSAAQAKATDLAKTAAAKAPDAAKTAATNVAKTAQAQAAQLPGYVTTAKQAAQSKLPARLGGSNGAPDDLAADGTLIYPVDGVVPVDEIILVEGDVPPVNGTGYSPETP